MVKKNIGKKKFKLSVPVKLAIAVLAVVFIVMLTKGPYSEPKDYSGKVVLDMYVMSQCPYGAQAGSEAIRSMASFGENVELNFEYIANSQGSGFGSLHGQPEVDENIRQLCIEKHFPEKHFPYVLCFNEKYSDGVAQYQICAGQVGIDTSVVESCFNGEGASLLSESIEKTNSVGASGSPTIYLNGEKYTSGRSSADFARAICKELNWEDPGCSNIPQPVIIQVKVLTSSDCGNCDTSQMLSVTQQLFPGATFEFFDLANGEGQDLVDAYNVQVLPAYLFGEDIQTTNTWRTNTQIRSYFEITESGYKLKSQATGASYNVDPAAREEALANLGIITGDNKPQIDFFVMSYCPYGNQAEEAIFPVFEQLKDSADFNPKYVIYNNYASGYPEYCLDEANIYCSMHGIQELNQDVRELCVAKYSGMTNWFDFALKMNSDCNFENADTCWNGVAETLGLDIEMISTCQQEEAIALLEESLSMGTTLGVRGSPTIFIDGSQYGGSRTSNGYLGALCAAFEDAPEACSGVVQEPVTQTSSAPAAGPGCGVQ
jgi:glutaredoxin